jgi:hypothetical protein
LEEAGPSGLASLSLVSQLMPSVRRTCREGDDHGTGLVIQFRWLATGVFSVSTALTFLACGDNRGGQVPGIRAAFEKVPGVHVIDVVGWDEIWPFFGPEDIRADLQIGTTGRLVLCDLTLDTVTTGGPFILARVGEWSLGARFRGATGVRHVAGCPNSVDVKPGSPFLELLSFPLSSPGDAIANYDQLVETIQSWPEDSIGSKTLGRRRIEYWKTRYRE